MGATATLTGRMAWDDSAFKRGIKGTQDQAKVMAGRLKAIFATAAAGFGVKKAFGAAIEFETIQTKFDVLLGSTSEAKKRMDELAAFAASTPFELPGLANASAVLQTMTNGALATGKGLTMVGDIAAASSQPIEEIAVHAGRLYAALQGGRKAGESLARLQELGMISVDTRNKIEDLQNEGKKGEEVWSVAAQEFSKFAGSMEKQSQTLGGKLSTLRDNVKTMFRAFVEGEGMTTGKSFVDTLNSAVQSMTPAAKKIGNIIGRAVTGLTMLTKPDFWKIIGLELIAAGQGMAAMIAEAVAPIIDLISDGAGTEAATAARSKADAFSHQADLFRNKMMLDMGRPKLKREIPSLEELMNQEASIAPAAPEKVRGRLGTSEFRNLGKSEFSGLDRLAKLQERNNEIIEKATVVRRIR